MNKDIDNRREVEITLDFPVVLGDRKLEKVTMRRPTVGDLLKHNINGAGYSLKDDIGFYADLCDLVPDELELFDFTDYEKIQQQFFRFRGLSGARNGALNGGSPD